MSTNEVEAVISSLLQQQDTIVYGVEVPGVEGRAGMAAIVEPTEGLDLNSFLSSIQKQLPSYARPLFLRLVAQVNILCDTLVRFYALFLKYNGSRLM